MPTGRWRNDDEIEVNANGLAALCAGVVRAPAIAGLFYKCLYELHCLYCIWQAVSFMNPLAYFGPIVLLSFIQFSDLVHPATIQCTFSKR